MTARTVRGWLACLVALGACGCASTLPRDGMGAVDATIRQRIGLGVTWNRGAAETAAVRTLVRTILSRPLQPEESVQVALLCNRGLQARFADIGVAQADLAQAGLLRNPVLDTSLRFPDRLYGITDVAAALSDNLLDLILLPARREMAAGHAETLRFEVAADILDTAADVRTAYWRLRTDMAIAALLRDRVAAADAAASLSGRMHGAGNISDLDLAREQAAAETTRADYADTLASGVADREDLNRLMGLSGDDAAAWAVPDDVPAPPPDHIPYDRLETLAIRGNLHIEALRREAESSALALGVARDYGWLGDVELGVSTEKNPEGYRVTGPTLQLALPLFDRGQASRQKAAAALARDEDRMAQLATDTRARVRAIRDRLVRDRDLADRYDTVVVPLRRRILALGVQQYDVMLLGPFDLLRARQDEMEAARRLVEARRDWWIESAELERAIGRTADIKESRP